MDTLYRHWLILRMIPRRTRISTTDILGRLKSGYGIETTLRTIQRDLIALETSEFPLECDNNKPAGWSWRKDAPTFDIPNMDPVTALAFRLTEQHMKPLMPHGALSALQPYFRAAGERLKQTDESSLSSWPEKVRIVSRNLSHINPEVAEEITETVYASLLEERRFKATYCNVGGMLKIFEVNPLGMALVDNLTYLVVSLNDHPDPVLLLLHRIQSVEPLDKPVTVPEGFDLDAYVAKNLAFPVGDDILLKLLFSKQSDVQRLVEAPISEGQTIRETGDGRYEFTATLPDTLQLRWWLRGFGERVEVVEPVVLRDDFVELAEKMTAMYLSDKSSFCCGKEQV